jgi:uncharacterized membrane protein SpoIIM required for sporulation
VEQIYTATFIVLLLILLSCLVLKLFYFILSGRTNFLKYLKSFLRRYDQYEIESANEEHSAFMRRNNRINLIFWSSLLFLGIVLLLIHLIIYQKTGA